MKTARAEWDAYAAGRDDSAWTVAERTAAEIAFAGGWYGAVRSVLHALQEDDADPVAVLLEARRDIWEYMNDMVSP